MLKTIQDPAFEKIKGVKHAFFTRQGGVSTGIYSQLNCCHRSKDSPDKVRENRQRVMSHLGLPLNALTTTANAHGGQAIVVNESFENINIPDADGMVTKQKNIVLASDSADCPIVLFADNQARVIGLAHAGWKSAIAGILNETINQMIGLGSHLKNIAAVIGPCILQPSYEVSPEFYKQFIIKSPENADFFKPSIKENYQLFDLLGFVRKNLEYLGLDMISAIGLDTYTNEDLFFSCRRAFHRQEDDFGGHFACIYLE